MRRHLLTAYSILFFAYLLLPIAVVIVFSFNHPTGKFNYTWQGFTWDNWRYWDGVPGIRSSIVLSLQIALLASLIATALGTAIFVIALTAMLANVLIQMRRSKGAT